eukprot:CFRG5013T1
MKFASSIILACVASMADAHGYLRTPRARGGTSDGPSSAICGAGGTRTGTTRATYTEGQTIEVEWETTIAHDGGFFEIRICDTLSVSQSCFDRNLLPLADGGATRVRDADGNGRFSFEYKLPSGLSCSGGCVMQWFWDTPNNGEYTGCTDIRINPRSSPSNSPRPSTSSAPRPSQSSTPRPTNNDNPYELRCSDRVSSSSCRRKGLNLDSDRKCCRYSNKCPGHSVTKCVTSFCCR